MFTRRGHATFSRLVTAHSGDVAVCGAETIRWLYLHCIVAAAAAAGAATPWTALWDTNTRLVGASGVQPCILSLRHLIFDFFVFVLFGFWIITEAHLTGKGGGVGGTLARLSQMWKTKSPFTFRLKKLWLRPKREIYQKSLAAREWGEKNEKEGEKTRTARR